MTGSRAQTRPVRAVFIGSGAFARPALRALAHDPTVELVGIVTAPPRPAGRKLASVATPLAQTAEELGAGPVLTPARLRDPASVEEILALEPDLIVLADYGQIVPPALLGIGKGALNLHPSLLPRHRGATPVPATILAGDACHRRHVDADGRGPRHRPDRRPGRDARRTRGGGTRAGGASGGDGSTALDVVAWPLACGRSAGTCPAGHRRRQ